MAGYFASLRMTVGAPSEMTAEAGYAGAPVIFSILIAVALNSAVPDLGSVASIVRMFVATSS